MSTPAITTGLDGVIASGNVPTWIVQEADMTPALTDQSTSIPASVLSAAGTVKADCYHDMGDVSFTRTQQTRDRKRACEKITVTVKTGETIDGTITAIYDQQQLGADADINAVYEATPEGSTIYVVIAYGHDSMSATPPAYADVYRGKVQMRSKNDPVDGEDLEYTATISADLYIEDAQVVDGSGE